MVRVCRGDNIVHPPTLCSPLCIDIRRIDSSVPVFGINGLLDMDPSYLQIESAENIMKSMDSTIFATSCMQLQLPSS